MVFSAMHSATVDTRTHFGFVMVRRQIWDLTSSTLSYHRQLGALSGSLRACQMNGRESTWTICSTPSSCSKHCTKPRRWLMGLHGRADVDYQPRSFRRRRRTRIEQRSFAEQLWQRGWYTRPNAPTCWLFRRTTQSRSIYYQRLRRQLNEL